MKKSITAIILLLCIFVTPSAYLLKAENPDIFKDPKEVFEYIRIFADAVTLVGSEYLEEIDIKKLVYGAIQGMTNALDGYSNFLDPEGYKEIKEDTKGEFGGVGIEIGVRNGVLTVISPIEDTPAYDAGIKSGDRIVKINGMLTKEMTLDDAVKKLRGKPGSIAVISVIREKTVELLEFNVKRAIIKLKSIKEAEIVQNDIGYIRILEFQSDTAKEMKKAINLLVQDGAKDLIIDLRNNPGGLFSAAVDSADLLLDPGFLIVYTEGRGKEKRVDYLSKRKAFFNDMNIVVLVNEGSASSSEILAGAIKDNKRGVVMGTRTFGKGSVQTVVPLKDGSAIRLTTAAYYTPTGSIIRGEGIEPDIIIELEKDKKKNEPNKGVDIIPEVDSQVAAAINVLKGVKVFALNEKHNTNG
jgi:carboxyl-terminal processing protease